MTRTQPREELTVTAEENHYGGIKQKWQEGPRTGHEIRAADCGHRAELAHAGGEPSKGLTLKP